MNNFQIAKIQSKGVAYYLLDFLPISAWRFACQSVAYKKKRAVDLRMHWEFIYCACHIIIYMGRKNL